MTAGRQRVPRSNGGTSPRVVLSLGGGDDGRALAVGSTAVQYRGVDRARDPGKLRRGRGGDRASTMGNGCSVGPRTPCGARTRCRVAARKARTGLPWVSSSGGLGASGGEGLASGSPPREGGLPGRGVSESAGRGAPKEGRGPRIRGVGRGLPAGIPEAQPAAPGLMGGWWPPKGHSHGGHGLSVAARSCLGQPRRSPATQGSHGAPPGQNWGTHGQLRPEGGKEQVGLDVRRRA